MTATLDRLKRIKHSHNYCSRVLTFAVVASVCLPGFILWWRDIPLADHLKSLVGFLLMCFAVLLYKIPHLAYYFNRWRFRKDADCLRLIGKWEQYKNIIA